MPDDEDGTLEDGRRWWMTEIKPHEVYKWIGRNKKIQIEDVHWDTQIVYYTEVGKSEILEMRPQRLYEYYELVKK